MVGWVGLGLSGWRGVRIGRGGGDDGVVWRGSQKVGCLAIPNPFTASERRPPAL